MKLRNMFAVCLIALPVAVGAASTPDAVVKAQLEKKELVYEIDSDGDFVIDISFDDTRTQRVWVRSVIETTDHFRVREIWSRGYQVEGEDFPARIANELLEDSNTRKLGSWIKIGSDAMYVIKISADAGADQLDEAILTAAATADEMELELTAKDDF